MFSKCFLLWLVKCKGFCGKDLSGNLIQYPIGIFSQFTEYSYYPFTTSHSSVGIVLDLRTRSRQFDPRLGQHSVRGLMIAIDRIHSSLNAVRCFDNDYMGKQPVAFKEFCAGYWLKEFQESMDRCIGRRDITEIVLKTALNTINQSINHTSFCDLGYLHTLHERCRLRLDFMCSLILDLPILKVSFACTEPTTTRLGVRSIR